MIEFIYGSVIITATIIVLVAIYACIIIIGAVMIEKGLKSTQTEAYHWFTIFSVGICTIALMCLAGYVCYLVGGLGYYAK